jgi:6-phosphogluconolactonase
MRLVILRAVFCLWIALSVEVTTSEAREFAYVSLDGENRIAVYSVNEETGELAPGPDVETLSPAGGLTSDPTNRFLFASLRRAGQLASFRINRDGGLTLINTVEAGADPAYVATDRTGRFLLTAYYVAAMVAVHRIGEDGSLSESPLQEISTNDKAHAIMTDASNRFAFVPHTGPNAIYQFRFNEQTGLLSPNDPLIVNTGENTGPRQLAFHPKRDLVFFDYEQGSAIASYGVDRVTGQLAFRERLSSIPNEFTATNSNARIEIHPTGDFVYVANRGHDSLAGYRVDAKTGKLTSLGQTPAEPTPRGFTIEPGGRFLYAAGQSSDRLAAFRIHQHTGALDRFATYEVGKQPWWVHVIQLR